MVAYTIFLDDVTARFYDRVGSSVDRPTAEVLADALFKLAAELSLEALARRGPANAPFGD
jgi:hypothetical protein